MNFPVLDIPTWLVWAIWGCAALSLAVLWLSICRVLFAFATLLDAIAFQRIDGVFCGMSQEQWAMPADMEAKRERFAAKMKAGCATPPTAK